MLKKRWKHAKSSQNTTEVWGGKNYIVNLLTSNGNMSIQIQSEQNILKNDSFDIIYKGELSDGTKITLKKMLDERRISEVTTGIEVLSKV